MDPYYGNHLTVTSENPSPLQSNWKAEEGRNESDLSGLWWDHFLFLMPWPNRNVISQVKHSMSFIAGLKWLWFFFGGETRFEIRLSKINVTVSSVWDRLLVSQPLVVFKAPFLPFVNVFLTWTFFTISAVTQEKNEDLRYILDIRSNVIRVDMYKNKI